MPRHAVHRYMTVGPQVVSIRQTIAQAHQLMREKGVRHLPVVDGARLVGVVSQRDLYLLETLKGVDPATEAVEEAMTPDPYTVRPETPLGEVAQAMADGKYGSAVVVDKGAVIGVFTTVDALRALAGLLRRGGRKGPEPRG